MTGRRAALACAGVLGAAALAQPARAAAHGLVQRADLPIPEWLFGWGAALVLVLSFAALAALWPSPRLQREHWRPLGGGLGRLLGSRPVEVAAGLVGVALLVVVVWAGFAGTQGSQDNLAPTFVFVIFWVGLVFASVLLGDVFRALNPWRAIGRAAGWTARAVGRRAEPAHRPYPERLGHWPAALALLAFTWIELASGWSDRPARLAGAIVVYSVLTLAAMAVYGVEPWCRRGEGFSVYFNLFSRLSVFETRDGVVGVRRFLSGLPQLDAGPGIVALMCVMIGTVTFDGLSQGQLWRDASAELVDGLASLGLSAGTAITLSATIGLVIGVLFVAGFYRLGISGVRSVGGRLDERALARTFAHTLVPIALVYVAAHYLTFLLFQGQAVGYLASDPLGRGWNLFGTATAAIDYGIISQNGAWYAQVGFVLAGHVCALVLAHDRALALYDRAQEAVRSQYWMLGVMVGFTTLALWLLAQANV